MMSTALSTEAYWREQRVGEIPSFTLRPRGDERSTIRRHLSECGFGTRPMGLTGCGEERGLEVGKQSCQVATPPVDGR